MSAENNAGGAERWTDTELAAACLAVAGHALGGLRLRARPGPVRDLWIEQFRALLSRDTPWRKIPAHCSEARLMGGLDLTATLRTGKPIAEEGILGAAHRGMVVLPMAERAPAFLQSALCRVLDEPVLRVQRDGLALEQRCEVAVLMLDEGIDEEAPGEALLDRIGLSVGLDAVSIRDTDAFQITSADIETARDRFLTVSVSEQQLLSISRATQALGIDSPRIWVLASRCVRVLAALDGCTEVCSGHLDALLRLVLLPRATQLPSPPESPQEVEPPPPPPASDSGETDDRERTSPSEDDLSEERLIEAAEALLPDDVLARLAAERIRRQRQTAAGKSGVLHKAKLRGRPCGSVIGLPRGGSRLDLLATLRTAAPWQRLRPPPIGGAQLRLTPQDFRIRRYKQRSPSVTLFVVDASGSSALYRLAEAKGAVELLLADCYVRRDEVALVAFKGHSADLVLPPTRSLVRAKKSLAALPGGGGTPLAAAIELSGRTLEQLERRGCSPVYVLLTDGRANISRDGATGRTAATEDAHNAAHAFRLITQARGMVIDTSPRPHRTAAELAEALSAEYLPLPNADARKLQNAVKAATA
ncbi:MAG: magnesium chelatase subunit D [Pseudomonadota bacterium]